MAQTHLLKRRIKSVSNTKQITKAMEVVSGVKMRRSQERMLTTRPYAQASQQVLSTLLTVNTEALHPLLQTRDIKRELLLIITSDRGLAGSYNSALLKVLADYLNHNQADKRETQLIIMGQKGAQFLSRIRNIDLRGVYTDWPTDPSIRDITPIATTIITAYSQHDIDSAKVLYTKFISPIKQTPIVETLLPLQVNKETISSLPPDIRFEPSPYEVLAATLPRFLEMQIYQANLEAIASEHSMRMMAMKNASDNANELIDELTLTFNSARQSAITQELAEITAGAEAIQ